MVLIGIGTVSKGNANVPLNS